MRVILTFLGLVSSLGACQATSNHPLASDAYSVWCREQTEIYRTWHASQPESQQRLADELVANLTQFLFHPPPGDEKHPRQTIAGWRERYLATVSNLGTRLRAFERSTSVVALAPFGMAEPDPPADEPYHRYPRGSPSINGYLRLLWEELVLQGRMDPRILEEPLFRVLSPRLTLTPVCAPGGRITETFEVNYLGWLQNPSPFQVRFDLEWRAGDSGRTPRAFPWLAGVSGGGNDDLGIIRAPREPGEYIFRPVLYFRVIDETGREFFQSRRALPEARITVGSDQK